MIKSTIFKNNNINKEAKETLEKMFEILPEKFNYLRYVEINDLYLNLHFININEKRASKDYTHTTIHLNFINY